MMNNRYVVHGTDILINKTKLESIMVSNSINDKPLSYIDLHGKICDKFKLKLSYKGFMSLVQNNSTWKLLYAFAVADVLNVEISELFDVVQIDEEKLLKSKIERKNKYDKKEKN